MNKSSMARYQKTRVFHSAGNAHDTARGPGRIALIANFRRHLVPFNSMCSRLGMWFVPGGLPEDVLDQLIREASCISEAGERVAFISRRFLGTPYRESTLIGDLNTPEVFVINLKEMDCLTFLEYVEAMRRSSSFQGFQDNLLQVRYRSGTPDFLSRNHFFTDWPDTDGKFVRNVTQDVGGEAVLSVQKTLNRKADGTFFLPGIEPRERTVQYLPTARLKEPVISRLLTGDYAGIYTAEAGLDVSHAGIVIREQERVFLRHASSRDRHRRVVDEDLAAYLRGKPGITVLRPR